MGQTLLNPLLPSAPQLFSRPHSSLFEKVYSSQEDLQVSRSRGCSGMQHVFTAFRSSFNIVLFQKQQQALASLSNQALSEALKKQQLWLQNESLQPSMLLSALLQQQQGTSNGTEKTTETPKTPLSFSPPNLTSPLSSLPHLSSLLGDQSVCVCSW